MTQHLEHNTYILEHIESSIRVKQLILDNVELIEKIDQAAKLCVDALTSGNKIILAGNGGSAADAQHIAAEFVSKLRFDRPALASISLATDTSMLTAIGNDYGYEKVFSRQLLANGNQGDIFIAISTSGNSENVIDAVKESKNIGITSIGFLGETGGNLKKIVEHDICVPSSETATIQECHIMIGHIICRYTEDLLFLDNN